MGHPPTPPAIDSEILTAIVYTHQFKNMFRSFLLRYVAISMEKLFDGFVDLLVDFDGICGEESGDVGGIVGGFFF